MAKENKPLSWKEPVGGAVVGASVGTFALGATQLNKIGGIEKYQALMRDTLESLGDNTSRSEAKQAIKQAIANAAPVGLGQKAGIVALAAGVAVGTGLLINKMRGSKEVPDTVTEKGSMQGQGMTTQPQLHNIGAHSY